VRQPAIEFAHVSKKFRLGENHDSLRDLLMSGVRRLAGRAATAPRNAFWALQDVDFSIPRGDAVGIIGPNGAGKSTILKLLSRILRPDQGSIVVRGRLAGLIEVGAGFHGDLTGRENVFLNGAILGMPRRDIRRKFDEIVAFAGLEAFLDMPVKRYSSGMYARLGFSIAVHVNAEVLLVDEVLSVGDAVFRLRCLDRMRKLVHDGTTLVFVTHDLDQMQSICSRTLVLNGGTIVYDGSPGDAVGRYLAAVSNSHAARSADIAPDAAAKLAPEITHFRLVDPAGAPAPWIRPREGIVVDLGFRLARPIARLVVEVNLRSADGHAILSLNSGRDGRQFGACAGPNRILLRLKDLPLAGGEYFWNIRMWDEQTGTCELDTPYRYPMVINEEGRACGIVSVVREWSFVGPESFAQQTFRHAADEVGRSILHGRTAESGAPCESLPVR